MAVALVTVDRVASPDEEAVPFDDAWLTADRSGELAPEEEDQSELPVEADEPMLKVLESPDAADRPPIRRTVVVGGCEVDVRSFDAMDALQLAPSICALHRADAAAPRGAFRVEPGREWAARASKRVSTLIPGVLVAGGIGVMAAEPKVGKTWLSQALAVSVATERPLLCQYRVETSGRVLQIITEGSYANLRARLSSLSKGHGVSIDDVLDRCDFLWRTGIQLDDQQSIDRLAAIAGDYALIIVDVLRDAWSGDENKSTDVGRLLHNLHALTDRGPTVLVLHHLSKPQDGASKRPGVRIRGSSALYGALDSGVYLEPLPESRVKVTLESRDERPAAGFTFALPAESIDGSQSVTLDWHAAAASDAPDAQLEGMVKNLVKTSPGCSRTSITGRISRAKSSTLEAIRRLLEIGELVEREGSVTRSDGRKVTQPGLFLP